VASAAAAPLALMAAAFTPHFTETLDGPDSDRDANFAVKIGFLSRQRRRRRAPVVTPVTRFMFFAGTAGESEQQQAGDYEDGDAGGVGGTHRPCDAQWVGRFHGNRGGGFSRDTGQNRSEGFSSSCN
jgi:hypothetical protein